MFSRPDTYTQDMNNGGAGSIQANGSVIPVFIGACQRGKVGVPFFINSFSDYEKSQKHANLYLKDSDLAYALKGYYDNTKGGAWVIRVAGESAACATAKVPAETGVDFVALDEGTWANGIKISVQENSEGAGDLFDIVIKDAQDNVLETYEAVSKTADNENFYHEVINAKSSIIRSKAPGTLATGEASFASGSDGSEITDTNYVDAIDLVDLIPNVRLLIVPGQSSSKNVANKMLSYTTVTRPEVFSIVDLPLMSTVTTAIEAKKTLSGRGACYYSWLTMLDPASKTGKNRIVPNSGHIAGVYSRIISKKGASENPAGTDAVIYGCNGLYNPASLSEMETLNPKGINSIREVDGSGICVWGVRTLSPDSKFKYISDCILDTQIKEDIKKGMMWAVFKGNCDELYRDITKEVRTYMLSLMKAGMFATREEKTAFYVKCDDTINGDAEKDSGVVWCEVGYARKRPGEFIVFKMDQRTSI